MNQNTVAAVCIVLVLCGSSVRSQTGTSSPCFSVLRNRVAPGDRLTLVLNNGRELKGRLVGLGSGDSTLTLAYWEITVTTQRSFTSSDLLKVKYTAPGHFRVLYLAVGCLAGALLGQLAEYSVFDPGGQRYPLFTHQPLHRGWFWGGVGGAAAGTALSFVIRSSKVITCR